VSALARPTQLFLVLMVSSLPVAAAPADPLGLPPAPDSVNSRRLDFKAGSPLVPIRLMEGHAEVTLSSKGGLRFHLGGPAERLVEGAPRTEWRVRRVGGAPATVFARIELAELPFNDKEGLAAARDEWARRGPPRARAGRRQGQSPRAGPGPRRRRDHRRRAHRGPSGRVRCGLRLPRLRGSQLPWGAAPGPGPEWQAGRHQPGRSGGSPQGLGPLGDLRQGAPGGAQGPGRHRSRRGPREDRPQAPRRPLPAVLRAALRRLQGRRRRGGLDQRCRGGDPRRGPLRPRRPSGRLGVQRRVRRPHRGQ